MPWTSTPPYVRALLPGFLFTFALLIGGCDTFGSDPDGTPNWVGNWEVVDVEPDSEEPPEDFRGLYSITEDKIETFTKSSNLGCRVDTTEITNVDGNVVTTKDDDGDQNEARLEASDETLTITPLGPEEDIEKITAESVDDDPADILNCSSSSASAAAMKYAFDRHLWPRE